MAITTTQTTTITARSRNLGYGWSHIPETVHHANGSSHFRIVPPSAPSAVGALATVEAEMARAARIHSGGTEWVDRLFVGGRPVIHARIAQDGREPYTGEVMRFGRPHPFSILQALRTGASVAVTLED